jgi:HD-GYP domain-containing protein (c-di-GMP phosphodiesterase class II)
MKYLHITSVNPGDIIAKAVTSDSGSTLLAFGQVLTEAFIIRLKKMGIDYLYIEDPKTTDLIPEEIISDETRQRALKAIQTTMNHLKDLPYVIGIASMPQLGERFRQICGEFMKEISRRPNMRINLMNLFVKDDYLFHQSINVTVLALMMGVAKGYNQNQLTELGMSALLFDIGMVSTPKYLWNKKTEITPDERQLIQTHATVGYEILNNQEGVPPLVARVALEHHERFDGTGYPNGLKGNQIHEYSQIVSIADVYSALTSLRAYRHRFTPSDAIEFLLATGNQQFDIKLIQLFCSYITIYPVTSTVRLNTGQIAVVSATNRNFIHRPVVRIIQEANGQPSVNRQEIDLFHSTNITIVSSL